MAGKRSKTLLRLARALRRPGVGDFTAFQNEAGGFMVSLKLTEEGRENLGQDPWGTGRSLETALRFMLDWLESGEYPETRGDR